MTEEWVDWTNVHTAVLCNSLGDSDYDLAYMIGVSLATVEQARKDVAKYLELDGQATQFYSSDGIVNKILLPVDR